MKGPFNYNQYFENFIYIFPHYIAKRRFFPCALYRDGLVGGMQINAHTTNIIRFIMLLFHPRVHVWKGFMKRGFMNGKGS